MRIASKTLYDNVNVNLSKTTEGMIRANIIVSTGKRINALSDDPVGLVTVLGLRSALEEVDQLKTNLSTGRSWLSSAESALTQVQDIVADIQALCVEMANAAKGAGERANAAAVVDGLLEQIVALANTRVGGRYLFSGSETDAAPFLYDSEGDPPTVTYQGNEDPFSISIGKGLRLAIGRDGERLFGDDAFDWADPEAGKGNLFKTLMDLSADLRTNDADGIRDALGALEAHRETLSRMISDTGTKMTRLEVREKILEDLKLTYTEKKSLLEDADLAEAVTNLQTLQTAYQAALASSAVVMKMSLVDFL
jgi:flagellar hook-associated protein 3 FlgL